MDNDTIEAVVSSGLCTSCGTCVSICPVRAIKMAETPAGFLLAKIDKDLCNYCGLCAKFCPGSHLEANLYLEEVDPFIGSVLRAYCGHATDPNIRRQGQSGGIVTSLLTHLLDTDQINKALVTRLPENGTLRPVSFFAKNQEQLCQAQGSKYCPVALNATLPRNFRENDSIAVVGISCQIHGIRNVQTQNKSWRKHIFLTIGLFCDRMLSYGAIDYLIEKGKADRSEVSTFRFKNKLHGKFPGNVCFDDKTGNKYEVSNQHRIECKDAYTPARCRLCFDKMNVLSDIAIGDAWGVREDKKGFSVILARTQRGLDLLKSAEEAGHVCLEKISAEAIFKGQGVQNRRKKWTNYTAAWKEKGRIAPICCINTKYHGDMEKGDSLNPYLKQFDWFENIVGKKTSKQVLRAVKWHVISEKIKARLFILRTGRALLRRVGNMFF